MNYICVSDILQRYYPQVASEDRLNEGKLLEELYKRKMEAEGFKKIKIRVKIVPYNIFIVGELDFAKIEEDSATIVEFKSYKPVGESLERARIQISLYAFLLSIERKIPYENIKCEIHYYDRRTKKVYRMEIEKIPLPRVKGILLEYIFELMRNV